LLRLFLETWPYTCISQNLVTGFRALGLLGFI